MAQPQHSVQMDGDDQQPTNNPHDHKPNPLIIYCISVLVFILTIIVLAVLIPLSALLWPPILFFLILIFFTLPKTLKVHLFLKFKRNNKHDHHPPDDVSSEHDPRLYMYYRASNKLPYFVEILMSSGGALLPRASLILLIWLIVNVSVPRLRNLMLLGSPLWKWSFQAVAATSAYFVGLLLYTPLGSVVLLIASFHKIDGRYIFHGLMPSGTLFLYSFILLLSWLFYFNTHSGLNQADIQLNPRAFEYVTWTCVSLFVGSVMYIIKAFLLVKWSANAIYFHFKQRILIGWVKFVYLGLLVDGQFVDEKAVPELNSGETWESVVRVSISRNEQIGDLMIVGRILESLAENVNSRDDDGASDVIREFEKQIPPSDDHAVWVQLNLQLEQIKKRYEKKKSNSESERLVELEEVELLKKIVVEELYPSQEYAEHQRKEITVNDLKRWMVISHKECVNIGRTLADAQAIVTRLDIFLSLIIWGASLLFWLLITKTATTQVLVTTATLLLTFAFIFGDTVKAFFQGLIFCFGTRPFNVGDRCILDDTELEVKRILALTTTFVKIGTNERRIYSNSVLTNKAIVNLGWHPDPTDVVCLALHPSTNITLFEDHIVKFFDVNKTIYKQGTQEVAIDEIGDKIKVSIHFTHILTVSDSTLGKCSQTKRQRRTKFLKAIKHLLTEPLTSDQANDRKTDGDKIVVSSSSPHITAHSGTSEITEVNDVQK